MMTFELDADGVRVWCSSPEWTRKLVEKGARLVDPAQAEYLREAEKPPSRPKPRPPRRSRPSARGS
jgi:hypothetical protein